MGVVKVGDEGRVGWGERALSKRQKYWVMRFVGDGALEVLSCSVVGNGVYGEGAAMEYLGG